MNKKSEFTMSTSCKFLLFHNTPLSFNPRGLSLSASLRLRMSGVTQDLTSRDSPFKRIIVHGIKQLSKEKETFKAFDEIVYCFGKL